MRSILFSANANDPIWGVLRHPAVGYLRQLVMRLEDDVWYNVEVLL